MKIRFDAGQPYQLDAIQAAVDVFTGQPLAQGALEVRLDAPAGELLGELGLGNGLLLSDEALAANVRRVQARHDIASESVEQAGRNFSVEMETGTGKTYVYLRTLWELRRTYGWKKFIVVVPSVAIREGVLQTIEMTRAHFAELYGNEPLDAWVYDSRQVSRLRQYAAANTMQLLVINIDAFNKAANNVIHQEQDRMSGRRPIEYIQAARPVVVLDEPQNMESETAKKAIRSLGPLCTLRYSATHRNLYNLLYRLDPVRAYDLRLVKRIEVDSVLEEPDFNRPYIRVVDIVPSRAKVTARLEIDVAGASGPLRQIRSVSQNGTDLWELSGERANYRGFLVDHIDAGNGYVAFTNGVRVRKGEAHGARDDDRLRLQVRETVREHLEKELLMQPLPADQRCKVLSLFFIDRVANYAPADGKIRRWFEEEYTRLAADPAYASLRLPPVEEVHNGYFAQDKHGARDSQEGRDTRADDEAYELIMRNKERLLSPDEPLRFLFSHSALREGWDNPNVFQICTLNETRSPLRKRQEIGRGLRLPVRANGERSWDPNLNRLTIIANESYHDFARALQTEMEEECGVSFEGRISNKRERRKANLKKGWRLDPDFQALWERINGHTRYSVRFDTGALIASAAAELKRMPRVQSPKFHLEKGKVLPGREGVVSEMLSARDVSMGEYRAEIPDLLGHLQRETELTRHTLAEILIGSGRLDEVHRNPQQFLDQALAAVREALHRVMVEGIKYERIAGAEYEMLLFEEREINGYLNRMVEVERSIYDAVEFDSEVEREFARVLDGRADIRLFIKLPRWLQVATPLGTYNPDWAIVKHDSARLYLVRETKGTRDWGKLARTEQDKIRCGKEHFAALGTEVTYEWVDSAAQV